MSLELLAFNIFETSERNRVPPADLYNPLSIRG